MSIKSDAKDVLANIRRLAEAYSRNRGVMTSATITRRQKAALLKAAESEELDGPDMDMNSMIYKGIQLKVIQ